jgi:hypothetical protein
VQLGVVCCVLGGMCACGQSWCVCECDCVMVTQVSVCPLYITCIPTYLTWQIADF